MPDNPNRIDLELRGIDSSGPIVEGQKAVEAQVKKTAAVADAAAEASIADLQREEQALDKAAHSWQELGAAADAAGDRADQSVKATKAQIEGLELEVDEARRKLDELQAAGPKATRGSGPSPAAAPSAAAAPVGGVGTTATNASPAATEFDAIEAAAKRAEVAAAKAYAKLADESPRAARPIAQVKKAVEDLEQAIKEVQGAGGPVRPADIERLGHYRAELKKLESGLAAVKNRQGDLADDVKLRQALTGEIRTLTSMQDVLGSLGGRWADFGAQAFSAVALSQISIDLFTKLRTVLNEVGESVGLGSSAFDEFIQTVGGYHVIADLLVNGLRESADASQELYEANLRNILQAKGIDTLGMSARDLAAAYRELSAGGRDALLLTQQVAVEGKALGEALEGDAVALAKRTAVIKEAIEVIERDGKISAQTAREVIKAIDEQQEALVRNNQVADPLLAERRKKFLAIAEAADAAALAAKHLAETDKRISEIALGLIKAFEGEESALRERTAGMLKAIEVTELDGKVTAQAAAEIVKELENQIEWYRRLGVEADANLIKLRDRFRDIAGEARTAEGAVSDLSDAVRQKMGLQAPAEIRKSAEAVQAYAEESREGGDITKEAAEKIATGYRGILEQVAALPEAERKALADVVTQARQGQDAYAELAEKRKSFAASAAEEEKRLLLEVAEAEKELLAQRAAEREAYVASLEEVFRRAADSIPSLPAGQDGAADLRKELEALRKEQENTGSVTDAQLQRMFELEDQLQATAGGADDLTKSIEGLGDASREQAADAGVVKEALADLVGTISEQAGAWRDLDPAIQETVQNIVSGLQDTAESGRATLPFLQAEAGELADVLEGAGFQVGGLRAAFGGAGAEGVDFGKELAKLGESFDEFGPKVDAAAQGLDKAKEAVAGARKEGQRLNDQLSRTVVLLTQIGRQAIVSV